MARTAAAIQAEITSLETYLQSTGSLVGSVSSRGTQIARADRTKISDRLDELYQQLGRIDGSAPMFARGQVTGLRGK